MWNVWQQDRISPEDDSLCDEVVDAGIGGDAHYASDGSAMKNGFELTVTKGDTNRMFELLPHQIPHVEALTAILDRSKIAFDFSMLGTGKTYTSSHLAVSLKIPHVVVVCPLTVAPKWRQMSTDHGIPVKHVLSYNSLRSVKDKQPKHGLLERRDIVRTVVEWDSVQQQHVPHDINTVSFHPTPALRKLAEEGVLFVLDEIQHFKNLSAQFEACRALIACARQYDASRVLLLSGSPIDKKEQTLRLFKAIGIFQADEIARYNFQTHDMEWTGMNEICSFARSLDASRYSAVPKPRRFESGRTLTNYAYQLFLRCVRPALSSSMIPAALPVRLVKMNGFYDTTDADEAAELADAVQMLECAAGYDPTTKTIQVTKIGDISHSFAEIAEALVAIEWAKRKMFVRLALECLQNDPNRKVVLCFNYSKTIRYVETALSEYDPLVLEGQTSQSRRTHILDAFQASNTTYRVLIGNVQVCSTGIDLDDKHGGFPRTVFINPNYSTITLYQLGHRFHRANTRSNANVFFVYGKDFPELEVLNALSRKSEIMKEMTPEQATAGVVFPVDMPSYYEGSEGDPEVV